MRIISRKRLTDFERQHVQAKAPLEDWYRIAEKATWENIVDTRKIFPSADLVTVKSGKVATVFNIGGNNYRLVASIKYKWQIIYILAIMTHEEYDRSSQGWKEKF